MTATRRDFVTTALAALALPSFVEPAPGVAAVRVPLKDPGFDPWLEIDPAALRHNVEEVSRLVGGRPIFGVVKNNAYGLSLRAIGPVLDRLPGIAGLAVVKVDEAVFLREVGVKKPVLLMSRVSQSDAWDVVNAGVRLAPFWPDAGQLLQVLSRRLGQAVPVHLYLDTGMNRLGMPYYRAGPWVREMAARSDVRIEGTFMSFTEDQAFDPEQLTRFRTVVDAARAAGASLGPLHAASSHGLFHRRDAYLDMVRPGLALYGAYPEGAAELGLVDLHPAWRLKARVVDVQQLREGDSVSYDRPYTAKQPTWVAVLPVGHCDGYPRAAVKGCVVLVGDRLYPVIAAVSASHTIVELGDDKTVEVGDEATLVGPDRPEITPNSVAQRTGLSVYDILMHLGALLPKQLRRNG
jgi:alanine racemase